MQNGHIGKLGWIAAAALAGLLLAGGFQGQPDKVGVVDFSILVGQSEFGKQAVASIQEMQQARRSVLQFIATNRIVSMDQAIRLRDLTFLAKPTDAQKSELEKLKSEILASVKKSEELAQKPNPTAEEKAIMAEYTGRVRQMEQTLQEWDQQFAEQVNSSAEKQQTAAVERARASVKELAKAQGFSMVFEAKVVPYGANDLTDAALKAMNARR